MVRKTGEPAAAAGAASKGKPSKTSKDAAAKVAATATGKPGKGVSVSALLANMDKKSDAPVASKSNKNKASAAPAAYTSGIDLPPSDEEDELDSEEEQRKEAVRHARGSVGLNLSVSEREQRKKDKKEQMVSMAVQAAKQEALKDDQNVFSVVIGTKTAVLDGEESADANVKDITISSFSVSARGKELLKNASLKISHGRRYGLVGPNGKGKSTLLKLLAWRQIPVPKNIDVLLVEQEVVGDTRSALEAVVSADEELMKLREEADRLQKISMEEDAEDVGEELNAVYERLRILGSEAAEARASRILAGLGFSKEMQIRATKSFSGGWRMRISLARALFVEPTLLLLDEPTNHLDLRAVLWLEEYLMRWKKTLVVVSHDRDFLNSVCTDIIHLHDEDLHLYRGNFGAFEEAYEQKRTANNKKAEAFAKQLKQAKRSGSKAEQDKVKDRAKYTATKEAKAKAKTKGGGGDDAGGSSSGPTGAGEMAPRMWKDYTVQFHFPEPSELTPPLLQLIDVEFSYPDRDDFSLKYVDVGIDMGSRVAIVGPNGAGKSTLLNLLAGDLTASKGEVRRSQKLRIGRYSQHFVDVLTMEESAVEYLLRLHPQQEGPSKQEAVRSKLGKFGLASHNHMTPIVKLSGGQKSRVVFTSISMGMPHILLLDEPTNHLDMQSIDALGDALEEFQGGVVLVSHDSRLISRVCEDEERSEIWVVEDGKVSKHWGSFQDYKNELLKEIVAEVED